MLTLKLGDATNEGVFDSFMSLKQFIITEKSKKCVYCLGVKDCEKNCKGCKHRAFCDNHAEDFERMGWPKT